MNRRCRGSGGRHADREGLPRPRDHVTRSPTSINPVIYTPDGDGLAVGSDIQLVDDGDRIRIIDTASGDTISARRFYLPPQYRSEGQALNLGRWGTYVADEGMFGDISDLLGEIAMGLETVAPAGWVEMTMRATVLDLDVINTVAVQTPDGEHRFTVGGGIIDHVRRLRERMYTPGTGTWYEAVIIVMPDRRVRASFNREELPREIASALASGGDQLTTMLLDDHRRYPRDETHLPVWHPARTGKSADPRAVHGTTIAAAEDKDGPDEQADAGRSLPGWDAIDAALEHIYPGETPQHWGTLVRWRDGGPDPCDGVSAYARTEPVPQWHYVTFGMSELYDKREPDPDVSGWGFELTFRLARDPGDSEDTEAPIWPVYLLQDLARYVFETGNVFAPGHHVDWNRPINVDDPESPSTLAFAEDPELGTIETPNGEVRFLQAVGLTADEYEAAVSWNTTELLKLFAERIPLLVTDIGRATLLTDAAIREQVRTGIVRDGSSRRFLRVEDLDWHFVDGLTLRVGEWAADEIARTLLSRLPYGNLLIVSSPTKAVTFRPAATYAIAADNNELRVDVPLDALDSLVAALRGPSASGCRATVSAQMPGFAIETVLK